MLKPGQCFWHIGKIGCTEDKDYCGKPTNFYYAKDDDGKKIRKYDSFCWKHKKLITPEK